MVLVSGFDAWVNTPTGRFAISSQRYPPDVVYPDGASRLIDFQSDPWPTWTWRLPDGSTLSQELFVPHGISACCLRWRIERVDQRQGKMSLLIRPLICGRDYHALHHENPALQFDAQSQDDLIYWHPYEGVPCNRRAHQRHILPRTRVVPQLFVYSKSKSAASIAPKTWPPPAHSASIYRAMLC